MNATSKPSGCDTSSCGNGSFVNRRDFMRWSTLATAAVLAEWPAVAGRYNEVECSD
jgi:hypothetical protein